MDRLTHDSEKTRQGTSTFNFTRLPSEGFFVFFSKNMQDNQNQEFKGIVLEALPNTTFKIRIENDKEILAVLSGKMRKNFIRVMPGDEVLVEVTPYDPDRGRIVWKAR